MMKKRLDLSESEIKHLLGDKYLHKLNDILHDTGKTDEKQVEIKVSVPKDVEKDEKKEIKQEVKQPSLFDF